jgi:hypothetical protein
VTAIELSSRSPDGFANRGEREGDPNTNADEPISIDQEDDRQNLVML